MPPTTPRNILVDSPSSKTWDKWKKISLNILGKYVIIQSTPLRWRIESTQKL